MKKWLFREHRGGLKESMETCKTFNSLLEVIQYAFKKATNGRTIMSDIEIHFYSDGDVRIGWSPVYIVCGKNEVIGFCTEKVSD